MSPFATASPLSSPRRPGRGQQGQTLLATLGVITVLGILVATGLRVSSTSKTGAARDTRAEIALEAADAGVQRYISRLVEDPYYYLHYVDDAEDARTNIAHSQVPKNASGPTAWDGSTSWTYTGSVGAWRTLKNGARYGKSEYSIRIIPPASGSATVTIISTGRVGSDTPKATVRTLQVSVRPSSLADFQMISNEDIAYGSTAFVNGKIYTSKSVTLQGQAKAPAYAGVYVCTSGFPCAGSNPDPAHFQGGAWDSRTPEKFSDVFPTPIDFSTFTSSISGIQDGAQNGGGIYLNDPTKIGWLVQFKSDGTLRYWPISGTADLALQMGTLATCGVSVPVPANGMIYSPQSIVVSDSSGTKDCGGSGSSAARDSVVNGRVTIATPQNIYIGGNVDYATDTDDVLGLIAGSETILTKYLPRVTSIRAAWISQTGRWRTALSANDGLHTNLNVRGSIATDQGGYASMFIVRDYQYDDTLKFLRPPLYPVLEDSWVTDYWREITPLA